MRPGYVAPYAGAWIETTTNASVSTNASVAPYAGAWIETLFGSLIALDEVSLPTRERGLKLVWRYDRLRNGSSLPTR